MKLADDFYTYLETCKMAKKIGVFPEEDPPDHIMERLRAVVERCLVHYRPIPGECAIKGVYLYREYEQAGDLRHTYGCCAEIGNNEAIIGLSHEMLEYSGMTAFHDVVFLHELAHLTAWEHGERFQTRFNDLAFDFFFYNRTRMDGKGPEKLIRSGWKM